MLRRCSSHRTFSCCCGREWEGRAAAGHEQAQGHGWAAQASRTHMTGQSMCWSESLAARRARRQCQATQAARLLHTRTSGGAHNGRLRCLGIELSLLGLQLRLLSLLLRLDLLKHLWDMAWGAAEGGAASEGAGRRARRRQPAGGGGGGSDPRRTFLANGEL